MKILLQAFASHLPAISSVASCLREIVPLTRNNFFLKKNVIFRDFRLIPLVPMPNNFTRMLSCTRVLPRTREGEKLPPGNAVGRCVND